MSGHKWNVTSDLNEAIDSASVELVTRMADRLIRVADQIGDFGPTGDLWHKEKLYREVGLWLKEIGHIKEEEGVKP